MPRWRLPLLVVGGILLGALLAIGLVPGVGARLLALRAPAGSGLLIGGPFSLVNQDGKPVTDATYRGRFMLVFFGYTFCPDVCPTTLQLVAGALDNLGPAADRFTPILITVDPERDTPAQLKPYVGAFHPRMVGLTGSTQAIDAAVRAYHVYARKTIDASTPDGYLVDHSAFIYIMDPQGQFVTFINPGVTLQALTAQLRQVL